MPRNRSHLVLALGVLAAALLLPAPWARAVRFTSTFDSIRIEAHPGQVVTRSFKLSLAEEGEPVRFRARVQDWWSSEDGRQSFYRPAGALPTSCGHWVALDPVETTVAPGGDLEVRVSVAVPPDAASGGSWCVLTVDEVPDPDAALHGVGVRFQTSVSVGIFVNVPPIHRDVEIRQVDVTAEAVELLLANAGNAPVAVEGRVELEPAGPVVAVSSGAAIFHELRLPRTTLLLAPVGTRRIRVPLPPASELPSGEYRVRLLLDLGLDHYLGVQKQVRLER